MREIYTEREKKNDTGGVGRSKKRSGKVAEVYYIGRDPIRLEDFGGYLGRRRK